MAAKTQRNRQQHRSFIEVFNVFLTLPPANSTRGRRVDDGPQSSVWKHRSKPRPLTAAVCSVGKNTDKQTRVHFTAQREKRRQVDLNESLGLSIYRSFINT